MQLIVDPRLKYNYASWYLYGLAQVVGRRNINYDVRPFRSLKYETIPDYNSGLALIYKEGTFVQKIFIDTEDRAVVFEDRYEWCDVYGKVNPTFEQVTQLKKLKAIGPGWSYHAYSCALGALCPLRPSRPASDAPPWSAPVGQNFSRKTRIHGKEEEGHRPDQASDRSRCSHPRTPRRPRTGPARREHHRVYQGVQRGHRIAARKHHPR